MLFLLKNNILYVFSCHTKRHIFHDIYNDEIYFTNSLNKIERHYILNKENKKTKYDEHISYK